MKKLLPALFMCLSALLAPAQSTIVKGYIITEKGDTLRGDAKVNPKKELDNYGKVTFKDANSPQKIYRPIKIKGYGFNDEHFISMDSQDDEKKFYKVLTRGNINFYKLGYEAMRMNEVVFEVEYYIAHGESTDLTLIKEAKFKKQLAEWMKDNTKFIDTYPDEKKFDYEKALTVIKNYNSWKAGK